MSGDENGTDRIGTTGLRSVTQVLRDDRPSVAEAVGLAAATAAEVAALHAAGQVHGHLDPDTVFVDHRGDVVLGGAGPHRIGPAAPPELVFADLRAVGRILALGLGWTVPDRRLPVPVEDLLARAEAAGTPSTALALALRRLQRDPALVASLLPPIAPAVPARPRQDARALAWLVPAAARRTTGVAAGLVAGIALVGGALLLIGAPASTGLAPRDAGRIVAAPEAAAGSPAPLQDAPVDAEPSSVDALLRAARTAAPVPPAPRRVQAVAPVARPQVQAVRPAPPSRAATPAPSSTGGGTKPTSAPAPSAPPSTAPSAPTGTPSAPPAPAPSEPAEPAPAPTQAAPSAPPAPSAPAAPAPERTTTTEG